MIYIKLEKEENGSRESQITDVENLQIDGFVEIPKVFEAIALSILPWIELKIENNEVISVTENTAAKKAWEATQIPIPTEQRKSAYSTLACIPWEGEQITVDSANTLWVAYSAEGSVKASQLSALIETAKQKIRAMYPDATV